MVSLKRGTILTLVVLTGSILLTGLAWAASDSNGNHNAPYLRMGVGARALGMGGAYVAVANDLTAGYWNPAGLAWTNGWQVGGMFSSGMDVDRKYNQIGASYGGSWGAIGFNWLNAGMTDIPQRNATGGDMGTFDFSDNAFMLSLAKGFDIASFGITGKYLREGLDANIPGDDNVNGYGIDLGFGLALMDQVRLGFAVQDIAGSLGNADEDEVDDIPTNLRAGLMVGPIPGLTAAFDVEKTQDDDDYKFHLGGEYRMPLSEDFGAAVRLGLNDGEFAAGFGLKFRFLEADYAYVNDQQDFLNENHRFSVALKFGEEEMMMTGPGAMRDTDRDGIPDDVDQCPTLAEDLDGFMDNDGCPDPDNDGDGIPDINDNCPNQAEDMDGWQDADGCPDVDNDGDGILDKDDKCPNVAEDVNGYQDDDGCPDGGQANAGIPVLAYINFKYDSAEISGADPIPVLEDVARIMRERPDLRLKITGHTDSTGSDQYNMKLSMRRADAIKDYLVKRGVSADRMVTEGKGESQPVDTNDTDLGRARNRRIEFQVLQ
ncbi:MAG: PorV/PorQ family protein [Candidatus Eisenbacteria bacterium]